MANVKPTDLFPSYDLLASSDTVTVAGIFIPLTSLPALSASEADPLTGNGMEIVRAVVNASYDAINGLPTDDKPTKAAIVKNDLKFLPNGNYERSYITKFELQFSDNAAIGASE